MSTDRQSDLTALIATCECAIRRGDVPHLESLHTLQRHLVAARDAPTESQTEAELRSAIQCYHQHVPAAERTTTFGTLTEEFDRVADHCDVSDGANGTCTDNPATD